MSNSTKRLVIISTYLALVLIVIWVIYVSLQPEPTCNDGIANQNEEQVDCGGTCASCAKEIVAENIEIIESGFVYGGSNKFDVFAKIKNPNQQYGSSSFEYVFSLKDSSGNVVGEKKGIGFILPYETKYVIETNISSEQAPEKMELTISRLQWEEFSKYNEPALGIYNKHFGNSESAVFAGEAIGLLRNESYFDFDLIKINIVLREKQGGKVVAVNTSTLNTVKSKEEREFRLTWPYRFDTQVESFEAEAEANVYDADNFIQGYLTGRKSWEN
jgi:hypothetical protein